MEQPFYARYSFKFLFVIVLALPVTFFSAFLAIKSNTNDVTEWLPASFIETDELNWFRDYFVGDAFILISWDGCTLGGNPEAGSPTVDDSRIEFLARKLVSAQVPATEDESKKVGPMGAAKRPHYFGEVMTGRRALDKLTSAPLNVPYEEAVKRLTGSLIGPVDPGQSRRATTDMFGGDVVGFYQKRSSCRDRAWNQRPARIWTTAGRVARPTRGRLAKR